jgi:hypothetical protein
MYGYVYKENKEFVVLFSKSDREKEFSWLDRFSFKVIPTVFIGERWEENRETFSVLDADDEKWMHKRKADQDATPCHTGKREMSSEKGKEFSPLCTKIKGTSKVSV